MIEIRLGQEEMAKLLKDFIPPNYIPNGYQIKDVSIYDDGKDKALIFLFEKKNGGAKQ